MREIQYTVLNALIEHEFTMVMMIVECPYCHRMRDKKAMYCRWCNDSSGEESTEEEFNEIDKKLKDMNC